MTSNPPILALANAPSASPSSFMQRYLSSIYRPHQNTKPPSPPSQQYANQDPSQEPFESNGRDGRSIRDTSRQSKIGEIGTQGAAHRQSKSKRREIHADPKDGRANPTQHHQQSRAQMNLQGVGEQSEAESAKRRLARKQRRREKAAIVKPSPLSPPLRPLLAYRADATVHDPTRRHSFPPNDEDQEPDPRSSDDDDSQPVLPPPKRARRLAGWDIMNQYRPTGIYTDNGRLTIGRKAGLFSLAKTSAPVHLPSPHIPQRSSKAQAHHSLDSRIRSTLASRVPRLPIEKNLRGLKGRQARVARNLSFGQPEPLLSQSPGRSRLDRRRHQPPESPGHRSYQSHSRLPPPGITNSPSWPTGSSSRILSNHAPLVLQPLGLPPVDARVLSIRTTEHLDESREVDDIVGRGTWRWPEDHPIRLAMIEGRENRAVDGNPNNVLDISQAVPRRPSSKVLTYPQEWQAYRQAASEPPSFGARHDLNSSLDFGRSSHQFFDNPNSHLKSVHRPTPSYYESSQIATPSMYPLAVRNPGRFISHNTVDDFATDPPLFDPGSLRPSLPKRRRRDVSPIPIPLWKSKRDQWENADFGAPVFDPEHDRTSSLKGLFASEQDHLPKSYPSNADQPVRHPPFGVPHLQGPEVSGRAKPTPPPNPSAPTSKPVEQFPGNIVVRPSIWSSDVSLEMFPLRTGSAKTLMRYDLDVIKGLEDKKWDKSDDESWGPAVGPGP